jgi:polyhydroxyalkanoate synthase subunit PhaC
MSKNSTAIEILSLADAWRRAQGDVLGALGFGPTESEYRVLASGRHWRLRDYGGPAAGSPVLIVAAPIKRPYIWDFSPSISAVRYCLSCGLHVYLLEWQSHVDEGAGLEVSGDRAIAECVARLSQERCATSPFLFGHSLGGTLAAIFAALESHRLRGLVLLGSPLCFQPASSHFRDALVSLAPLLLPEAGIVPGAAISHLSVVASPSAFVWSRIIDTMFSFADAHAMEIRARVERWALDEVALPARLAREVVQWLYRENRFCQGRLPIRDKIVGPCDVRVPTLAVVNTADDIANCATVKPFLDAIPMRDVRLIEYPGETGVGLQHLAVC